MLVGLVVGVVLLAAFAGHALRRADRALVDLRLFADRAFATRWAPLLLLGRDVRR